MIREDFNFQKKGNLIYPVKNKKIVRFKPWLGDLFAFMYDSIMSKSIFPKKFKASTEEHERILNDCFKNYRNKSILEIAAGSGASSEVLDNSNTYRGIDISPGLLKRAWKKFKEAGFSDFDLYTVSATDLPFKDGMFDLCICSLSFNFFPDQSRCADEIKRVLKSGGTFFCSVPVPDRNVSESPIRGTLRSEKYLAKMFEEKGFVFKTLPVKNGALFYFTAEKR